MSGVYYCKWIYGDDNLIGLMGVFGVIPTILGFCLVSPLTKRLGVVKTINLSFAIGAISIALRVFDPYNFAYNVTLSCFSNLAMIPVMCLTGVLTAMTIDYNEYIYEDKMVAISQSAIGFGCKIGGGIGGSVVGWILGAVGYNATMKTASSAVELAIFSFSIYIPMAVYAIMFLLMLKFDLEKKLPEIKKVLERRREK